MAIADFEKAEDAKITKQEIPDGYTLSSILEDEEKSGHFGTMLKESGDPEDQALALRLSTNKLEEGDLKTLEGKRVIANERFKSIENTEKFLTKENILSIAENNERFKKIINLVGEEKAISAIKNELSGLAFTDFSRFQQIEKSIDCLNKFKNEDYKELDKEITQLAKDNKIKDTTYAKLLAIEDDEERAEKIRAEIRKNYGLIRKGWDSLRGTSKKQSEELANRRSDLVVARNEIKDKLEKIGSVMSISIDQNETLRKSLSQELSGKQKSEKEKNLGFKNVTNMIPTVENTKTEWIAFKKENKWATASVTEKDDLRTKFLEGIEKKRLGEKSGFWKLIFDILSGEKRDDLITNLN